jgi:NAD(P)-dependent dehydrogenase (short-subunit alcohol dehydrogenase family)
MREFAGKTAFVTGGAGGIGLALGRAFAKAGMKVMLADIETDALQAAVKSLQEISPDISGTICDVADAASVERAAQARSMPSATCMLCATMPASRAGGGIDHISLDNWRWVIDVNLMGVLHGIKSFLPHIRAHGEGGHIVNTASMAGCRPAWDSAPMARANSPSSACRRGFAFSSSRTASASACCVRALSAPVSARAGATGPSVMASRSRSIPPVRRRPWWPQSRTDRGGLDPAFVAARVLDAIREDHSTFSRIRHAGRGGGAICRHFGRDGQGSRPIILRRRAGAVPGPNDARMPRGSADSERHRRR